MYVLYKQLSTIGIYIFMTINYCKRKSDKNSYNSPYKVKLCDWFSDVKARAKVKENCENIQKLLT